MTVALINGDIVKIRTCCYTPTQIGINVHYYRVLTAPTGPVTDLEVAVAVEDNFDNLYKACISSDASWRGIGVQLISPTLPYPVEQVSVAQAGIGTGAAGLLATQTCGIITKLTAYAARYARGRSFIPFPAIDAVTAAGAASAGYLAVLTTLANELDDLQTIVGVAGTVILTPVIRSLTVANPGTTPVTVCKPSTKLGTQRSRGQYGKPNALPF